MWRRAPYPSLFFRKLSQIHQFIVIHLQKETIKFHPFVLFVCFVCFQTHVLISNNAWRKGSSCISCQKVPTALSPLFFLRRSAQTLSTLNLLRCYRIKKGDDTQFYPNANNSVKDKDFSSATQKAADWSLTLLYAYIQLL